MPRPAHLRTEQQLEDNKGIRWQEYDMGRFEDDFMFKNRIGCPVHEN